MAGDGSETEGWEPQGPKDYSDRGEGRGATTGGGVPVEGGWDHGKPGAGAEDELLPNGDRASARRGAPTPEGTRTGWGGEGEPYPSADGPPNDSPPRNRPTGEGGA